MPCVTFAIGPVFAPSGSGAIGLRSRIRFASAWRFCCRTCHGPFDCFKRFSGKEFVVLLICDGFSNVMQAFPLTSKDHNAVQECLLKFIGTHKGQLIIFHEACRSIHLQAGFALVPALWPYTCQYRAIALSIPSWEKPWLENQKLLKLKLWKIYQVFKIMKPWSTFVDLMLITMSSILTLHRKKMRIQKCRLVTI